MRTEHGGVAVEKSEDVRSDSLGLFMLSLYKLFHRYYLINMNRNSAAVSSTAFNSNSRSTAPAMAPRHRRDSRSPRRAPGARGSRDPPPPPAASAAAAAPPGAIRVAVHQLSQGTREIILSGFPPNELSFHALNAHARHHMVDAIVTALERAGCCRVKVRITWKTTRGDDAEEQDFHMCLNIMQLLEPSRHVTEAGTHVDELLNRIDVQAAAKKEFAEMHESKITFKGLLKVQMIFIRDRRAHDLNAVGESNAVPPPHPPAVGRGVPVGRRWAALPLMLSQRQCCINVTNQDDFCFRYTMIMWRNGWPTKDPHRPQNYITNVPAGRPPAGWVPEFEDCGLNFEGLTFPVQIKDLDAFEELNDIGIYAYEWHDTHAALIRRPAVVRDVVDEAVVLLHEGHWIIVSNIRVFLAGPRQIHQHICYRCGEVFWHSEDKLNKHLQIGKCLTDVSQNIESIGYRLPKEKNSLMKFSKFEQQLMQPITCYADFETYQQSTEAEPEPQNDGEEEQRPKGLGKNANICSKNKGVASWGYYVRSDVPAIPSGAKMQRTDAVAFLKDIVDVGMRYKALAESPVPLIWTAELEEEFRAACSCYLCGKAAEHGPAPPRDAPFKRVLVRDHDHFTGRYRGAACQFCNSKAKTPKHIVVFFHNLEKYDGHEIVLAIAKLRGQAVEQAIAEANFEDDADMGEMEEPDGEPICGDDDFALWAPYDKLPFKIIANTKENYMQILFGPVVFRDSFRFNATSMDEWIKSQRRDGASLAESFPILSSSHPFITRSSEDREVVLNQLLQKVPMAYSSIDSPEYFELPAVLNREAYNDDLRNVDCSEERYELVKKAVEFFSLRDQGEYHDLYLYTDFLALADCMESMRRRWFRRFGLDMVHNVTMPSASFQAMFKMTDAKVKLVTDNCGGKRYMDLINKNIRGGLSCIFQPYAKANNWTVVPGILPERLSQHKQLHHDVRNRHVLASMTPESINELLPSDYRQWIVENGFDPAEETSWIAYVDANSLYPTVMSQNLPVSNYQELELAPCIADRLEFLNALVKTYRPDGRTGYHIEATYHVPEHLHDYFDLAPIAKRKVRFDELSPHQRDVIKMSAPSRLEGVKLFPFLGEIRECLHTIDMLQYLMELGVVVTDVHSIWTFQQTPWLRNYIKSLAQSRAQTDNGVEKQLIKIVMNSLYGKFCQDKLKQRQWVPFTSVEAYEKAAARCGDYDIVMREPFLGLVSPKKRVGPILDTPRPAAFHILENSKLVMFKGHYKFFRQRFGDRCCLHLTDTDSFIYKIKCRCLLYELMQGSKYGIFFDLLDSVSSTEMMMDILRTSSEEYTDIRQAAEIEMAELRAIHGKLGAFKLESKKGSYKEFVGLAAKLYSLLKILFDGETETESKGKAVPTYLLKNDVITHEHYLNILHLPWLADSTVSFKRFQSFQHVITKIEHARKLLTAVQDKTYQIDALTSRPLGHWRNRPEACEDVGDEEL